MRYRGVAVCAGVALSQSFRLAPLPEFDYDRRAAVSPERAKQVYRDASAQLENEFRLTAEQSGGTNAELLEVQLAMLNDESFAELIGSGIAAGYAPETAVLRAARNFEQMLAALDDEYMAARADDVRDLGVRLACKIAKLPYPSLAGLTEDCIVVAHDLLPSMLITAELSRIRGIVTENGTRTSHIAILAAGLEIPSIVGCRGAMEISHGELVFLDGEHGTVENELQTGLLEDYRNRELVYHRERKELLEFAEKEAVTRDGKRVLVLANIVNPLTLDKVLNYHADGVGLFRTEFLYMNRATLPTEEEQFAIYAAAAKKLGGLPLTIRTMDIGGDKEAECLHLPKEDNPFLGYRAVRISLERKDVILPQLRAILRAAVYGEIWVMFPMIAVKKELDGMLAALEEAKAQLTGEGIPFGKCTRVGMMAEVPSAVIMLDKLAKSAEFVSIGSNDLTQYTYAADRMNPRVSYLGDFLDPAVLRMIKRTIDVSHECGIDCSLCGEMAGDALGLAALVALGIHKVSVSPSGILKTKKRLSLMDTAALCGTGELMINAEDATEVKMHLLKALPEEYAQV